MTDDRQPQEERDRYWWETITEEDRKRHQEYREELKQMYKELENARINTWQRISHGS